MLVMLAGALPMVRAAINDAAANLGGDEFENIVDQIVAGFASLRGDDRPAILILRALDVPDGAPACRYIAPIVDTPGNLERFVSADASPGTFTVELGQPVRVPNPADWL
jgi:hypothetical protein